MIEIRDQHQLKEVLDDIRREHERTLQQIVTLVSGSETRIKNILRNRIQGDPAKHQLNLFG